LEGDVDVSYTAADNSVVVATDSSAYIRLDSIYTNRSHYVDALQSRTSLIVSHCCPYICRCLSPFVLQTLRKLHLIFSIPRNLLSILEHSSYQSTHTSIRRSLQWKSCDGHVYLSERMGNKRRTRIRSIVTGTTRESRKLK
jgi:hypothetical protein